MNCMVFPWVSYLEVQKAQVIDMGDIEYLSIKEFDGKVRSDEGFLSAIGDLATLTATVGKDMYLARAQVTFFVNTSAEYAVTASKVELKINSVIIETSAFTSRRNETPASGGAGSGVTGTLVYEFKNIGRKVLAGEIIKLEVTVLDTECDVEGFIECFGEDTGTTPQIPPL